MIKWLVKKYVLGMVNDVLDMYKSDVSKVTTTLATWIARLEKVLNLLKCLNTRVEDGKIDEEEVEASIGQVASIVKEW